MFEPTAEQRALVQVLAERGLATDDMLCLLQKRDPTLQISVAELEQACAKEMRLARAESNLAIADGIQKLARSGNPTILIYLSKVHLGWSERAAPKNPADEPQPTAAMPTEDQMGKILRIPVRSSPRSSA